MTEPQDRTPEQIEEDLEALRKIREENRKRAGIYGANLDYEQDRKR